jgi:hypothetical protein
MKLFERATRNKYRFEGPGTLDVEDLWDLPVATLDDRFYIPLMSQLKNSEKESLLARPTKEDKVLKDKIEIIKYIVAVKQDEARLKEAEAERKAKKERVLGILADKQDESLKNMSEEELEKMLDELSG